MGPKIKKLWLKIKPKVFVVSVVALIFLIILKLLPLLVAYTKKQDAQISYEAQQLELSKEIEQEEKYEALVNDINRCIASEDYKALFDMLDTEALKTRSGYTVDYDEFRKQVSSFRKENLGKKLHIDRITKYPGKKDAAVPDAIIVTTMSADIPEETDQEIYLYTYFKEDEAKFYFGQMLEGQLGAR